MPPLRAELASRVLDRLDERLLAGARELPLRSRGNLRLGAGELACRLLAEGALLLRRRRAGDRVGDIARLRESRRNRRRYACIVTGWLVQRPIQHAPDGGIGRRLVETAHALVAAILGARIVVVAVQRGPGGTGTVG